MATFTDIYKNELKSKGVLSSLGSAVVGRTKERMDPRNILFGGKGMFAATGQKIFGKGFSAIPKKLEKEESSSNEEIVGLLKDNGDRLNVIGKNTMPLRAIARDMNVMRQNTVKLVKLAGGNAATKADMFFRKQGEEEKAYENALKKEGTKPEPVAGEKEDKKSWLQSLFSPLLTIATTIAGKLSKILTPVLDMFGMIKNVFSSPLKILLSLGGTILKAGRFLIGQMFRLLLPFLTNPIVLGLLGAAAIAWLVKYLIDTASPEANQQTAEGMANAMNDAALPTAIMEAASQTSDVERRRQNLLANRSGDDKSLLFWKDIDLQKKYLEKIGFDNQTGLTKAERDAGFTSIDSEGKPIKPKPTPASPESSSPAPVAPAPAPATKPSDTAPAPVSSVPSAPLNIKQTDFSTQTEAMKNRGMMKKVVGAVFHHTGGDSVSGAIATLKQRKLSYHYIIDKKGNIHQLLPDGAVGFHTTESDKNGIKGVGNSNTIGIAMAAADDKSVTPEQVQAAQALNSMLAKKFGYNPKAVFGHGEISTHKSADEGKTVVSSIRNNENSPALAAANPSTGSQVATGSTQVADAKASSGSNETTVTNVTNKKASQQPSGQQQATASPHNPDMNGLLLSKKAAFG